ncbi:hypothetical protein IDJ75_00850 [Mucilaginibacter rigui]|uniref:Glycosyl-4,4'-diaponeurosporenoate acyltransferase n=1 Tax=Mucilaginibacter rigui TaxID=534635 RepID=A0ABR7X1E4_9SPHI|nr:hypothetical protein [Mucilaginibacter rigui]MBD1383810.1 hypothetical protein [Mucilaginibacter rigui]
MNQAINFFWTILCFIPVIGFWMAANSTQLLYVLILLSFLSLLIPAKVLQLSHSPKFYEALGVKFIRKLVQNGEYATRFIRKNNPQYKLIKDKANAAAYMRTIVMYERYHLLCFTFFLLSAIYAIITMHYAFFVIIMLANIIYNISPILLQQYNRARVLKLNK